VRRGTHGGNGHPRWPKFKAADFEATPLTCLPKGEGTSAGGESGRGQKTGRALSRHACARGGELDGPTPKVQGWNRPLVGSPSGIRRPRAPRVHGSRGVRLARGARRRERSHGQEGGTSVAFATCLRDGTRERRWAASPRGRAGQEYAWA